MIIVNLNRDAAMRRTHGYASNCVQRVVSKGLELTRSDSSAVMSVNALIADATPDKGCVVGVRYEPSSAVCRFVNEGANVGLKKAGDGIRVGTVWNSGETDGTYGAVTFDADLVTVTGAFLMTSADYDRCVAAGLSPFFSYLTMPLGGGGIRPSPLAARAVRRSQWGLAA